MFERFTPRARNVVRTAQDVARELEHHHIGTEHLLVAMAAATDPIADTLSDFGLTAGARRAELAACVDGRFDDRKALAVLGIDLDEVTDAVESSFGRGALDVQVAVRRRRRFRRAATVCGPPSGQIPFSPRAKKVLELSLREALRLKHQFIAPEHIALGVMREGQGLACAMLAGRGVDFAEFRSALERAIVSDT